MSTKPETTVPDYWKEPERPKGISLMGWTLILSAIAIPAKIIWEMWQ